MTDYSSGPGTPFSGGETYPSPDGKYFFLLSFRGDLTCGCTHTILSVYETAAMKAWVTNGAPEKPPALHALDLTTRKVAGTAVQFSLDGAAWATPRTIIFLGVDSADNKQIYQLDAVTGKLDKLTNEPGTLNAVYLEGVQGTSVIYRRQGDLRKPDTSPLPLMAPMTRDKGGEVFATTRNYIGRAEAFGNEYVGLTAAGKPWTLPIVESVNTATVFMSTGGEWAVLSLRTENSGIKEFSVPRKFVLVDFRKKKLVQLGAVAAGGQTVSSNFRVEAAAPRAFWTEDGSEAIVVNTEVPGKDPAAGYIAAFDPAVGRWTALEEIGEQTLANRIRSIGWLNEKELLVAREKDGRPSGGTVHTREGAGKWSSRTVDASVQIPARQRTDLLGGLKITARQSMNEPPVLVASFEGKEKAMTGADPALAGVGISPMRPFTFTMPDGSKLTGGLTLPRDHQPGKRLPLVIQNSGYDPDRFFADGDVPSGYARQALASQGYAVLEIYVRGGTSAAATIDEGPIVVARVDAAVEQLVKEGIVDETRVGMVGQSRRGWQTHYAVTHPGKVKIKAAEVWDSTTQSYTKYVDEALRGNDGGVGTAGVNGGNFWENKAQWLKHNVQFNADRMEAATLFVDSLSGQIGLDGMFREARMTMGALRHARRPFDYVFFPEGAHVLPGARFRKAAMDLTVDWMNFWLSDKEDSDPAKVEQYERWRLIRKKNEERKAEEAKIASAKPQGTTQGKPDQPLAAASENEQIDTIARTARAQLKSQGIKDPGNDTVPLNKEGYRILYVENRPAIAQMYFNWNLQIFPRTARRADMLDSLAECYVQQGNVEKAIEFYEKALQLKPNLGSKAKQIVAKLKADPASLPAIQQELREDYAAFLKTQAKP
jgi:tetratricopeptide (TPR) repeat protein